MLSSVYGDEWWWRVTSMSAEITQNHTQRGTHNSLGDFNVSRYTFVYVAKYTCTCSIYMYIILYLKRDKIEVNFYLNYSLLTNTIAVWHTHTKQLECVTRICIVLVWIYYLALSLHKVLHLSTTNTYHTLLINYRLLSPHTHISPDLW